MARKTTWYTGGAMALMGVALMAFQNCSGGALPTELSQSQQAAIAPNVIETPAQDTPPAYVPPPPALQIQPTSASLANLGTITFSASNGSGGYVYSIGPNCGSINSSSGAYTAPDATATCEVTVTDGTGTRAVATVQSTKAAPPPPKLSINPSVPIEEQMATLSGTGGTPPYSYELSNAYNASIAGNMIIARTTAGPMTIRLTDSAGQTDEVTVQVPADQPSGAIPSLCSRCTSVGTVITCNCVPFPALSGASFPMTIDYGQCVHSRTVLAGGQLRCNGM